ncbi:MAG: M4 family metallopeptidase [Actinomycetota bacterium]|nr:M4 family metallopeptidase [Actinomycetota bacterium]
MASSTRRRTFALTSLIGMAAFAVTGIALTTTTATAAPAAQPLAPSVLAAQTAANLVSSRAALLHASPDDAFIAHPVISVPGGLQYVPYDRTYKGLPVFGGDFVVTTNAAGQVQSTAVQQTSTINLSTTAVQTAAQAATVARTHAALATVDSVSAAHETVLAIGSPKLAWETVVSSHTGPTLSKLHVFTDAATGKVLYSYDGVRQGDGTAHYNGPSPVHIDTTHSGSTYTMTDPTRSGISCRDITSHVVLSGPDDLWGNGSATNEETGCVDALFDVQHEWSMLSAWLGRNGIDGSGHGYPISMNWNAVNAQYTGTDVQVGHNNAGDNIAAIDVIAHEFGHGVDDHTPGGIGSTAVAEFTADVFGAMTEAYTAETSPYDTPDYTVGEEINLTGNGPIRYMYHPSLISGHPDCYSSSVPSLETHAAAGPGNHWFYLVAEGTNPTDGQPASPTCNSTTITGIGIQAAGKIFYNAMLAKTTNMSYLKYRTATLTAAKNLYPGDCSKFNVVKAAWDAVSVPAQSGDPTCTSGTGNTVTVTNPGAKTGTIGTATSLQILASDSASGQTLTYSATGLPTGLSINASTGLISGTPTTAGTYTVTVTVTDGTGASGTTTFTWTISGSGGSCSGQQLGNPGFETGTAAPWTTSSGVVDNSTGEAAHSGSWKAWMDGYGTTHTDNLSQTVTIPPGCHATLSFYLHIDTAETGSTAYDKLTVKANSTTLATYSNVNAATGFTQKSFDLSSFAGQTVTITFTAIEDSSLQTSFVIDDVAVSLS